MGHDPLCPMQEPEPGETVRQADCQCDLIAKVRADERLKVLAEYGLEDGQ